MPRLRSDFWVSALLRRLDLESIPAVQRRRGAPEAGAIFVKVDRLDGNADLYGPAPQALFDRDDAGERRFVRMADALPSGEVEQQIARQTRFDSDLWLIEIDDRLGRHLLELAE